MKRLTFLLLSFLAYAVISHGAEPVSFQAARELFDAHRHPQARAAFEAISAAEPKNTEALRYLAELALAREDEAAAIALLDRAIKISPNDARLHAGLADAYSQSAEKAGVFQQLSLARKAGAAFTKAISLDPSDISLRESYLEFCLEAPSIAGGGSDNAALTAAQIARLDPARGHRAQARIHMSEKEFESAYVEYRDYLSTNPDDYTALFDVGQIAARTGNHLDEGLSALKRCLQLTPGPGQTPHAVAHYAIGRVSEKKGDTHTARSAYEAALKADPSFTRAADALKLLK